MLPESPTCSTCKWWLANDGIPGGTCDLAHEMIERHVPGSPAVATGDQFFAYSARTRMAGYLHTGPDFGCIHHEPAP